MNNLDQVIRLLLGTAIIYFGFFERSLIPDPVFGMFVGAFGVLNTVSALVGICPVYTLAGIATNKQPETSPE